MPLAVVLALAIGANAYQWPLDLPKQVTGTFGEYRPGRLHTGTDLHTGGNGVPIHAQEDGYVTRVRCSPYGFGKAVYLRLNDGRMVVLGHLSDYRDDLRDYVRKAQYAAKNYTVELEPKPNEFPVKRGETIAKSGDTGIGPSHLHFEVRDNDDRPIDPRQVGFSWPDKNAPVLKKALIAPHDPQSRVNGSLLPVLVEFTKTPNGDYTCAPVRVEGKFGIGIELVDPTPAGDKLGVYDIRLKDGDTECFRVAHDKLSYDHLGDGIVAYHPYCLPQGDFLLLWRWPNNTSEIDAYTKSDGWIDAPAKAKDLRIEVEDFMGNRAVLILPVMPGAESVPAPAMPKPGHGDTSIQCAGDFLVANTKFTAPEATAPALTLGANESPTWFRTSNREFESGWAPAKGGLYTLKATHPRTAVFEQPVQVFMRGEAKRTAELDHVQLTVDPESPYGTIFAWPAAPPKTTPDTRAKKLGALYQIEPALTPINKPVHLSFPLPEGVERLNRVNVYAMQKSGWSCQETTREEGRVTIATRRFGVFAVMEDTQPPSIAQVSPINGFTAKNRRPAITATVADPATGIDTITVTFAGKWLLCAYDPERNKLTWERDQDLASGRHELTINATDKAGNKAVDSRFLIIP